MIKRNTELNNPEEIKRKQRKERERLIVSCMTVHLELSFIVVVPQRFPHVGAEAHLLLLAHREKVKKASSL